jgi:hypothetical protein
MTQDRSTRQARVTLTFDVNVEVAEYVQRVANMIDELEQIPGVTVKSTVSVDGVEVSILRRPG